MFCSRSLHILLNQIQKRALRLIYNDNLSSFENILEISNGKTIHQQNLEFLSKKVHKLANGLFPLIISDVFIIRENPYNHRNLQIQYSSNKRSIKLGIEIMGDFRFGTR